ncbi:hypothetical protein C1D09_006740, partial [Mesorhizobium intechi]
MERRKTGVGPNVSKAGPTSTLQQSTKPGSTNRQGKSHLAFGIGCFNFASLRPEGELSRELYFADLKDYILSDKLVKNFEIEIEDNTVVDSSYKPQNITDDIAECGYVYPYISNCLVRFEIHIPKRVQQDYILSWREPTSVEDFTIEIDYSEDIPVTYVWLDGNETSPSTAVSI